MGKKLIRITKSKGVIMFWFVLIFGILCAIFKWSILGTLLCLVIVLGVLYNEIKGIEGGK